MYLREIEHEQGEGQRKDQTPAEQELDTDSTPGPRIVT